MKTINSFDELVEHLVERRQRKRVAVVCPNDVSTLTAVTRAVDEGFIEALLVGCHEGVAKLVESYGEHAKLVDAATPEEAALKAVELVRDGQADVLMKGFLNTDTLLHAVLNKENGILPKGQVLTHITCAQVPGRRRLIYFTEAAVIPYPNKVQREAQLRYVLDTCRRMGIETPQVALINCSEKVNAKHFPFTVEYQELIADTQAGQYGPCIVDGPLDLKTSLSAAALHKKGLTSPLEGEADGLIFPDIQAGNVFYKTITLFGHARTAAILAGPQVPVVLTSRADALESKYFSLAPACI
jgi:phosphate butyryltransferase